MFSEKKWLIQLATQTICVESFSSKQFESFLQYNYCTWECNRSVLPYFAICHIQYWKTGPGNQDLMKLITFTASSRIYIFFVLKRIILFLNFYWNVVDLQCCVKGVQQSDSVTYICIYIYIYTHTYIYLYTFKNSLPL